MCGIAGALRTNAGGTVDWTAALQAMNAPIVHRGPDDSGIWFDEAAGVGLAHRRLSIVDLSPAGHQPMVSQAGRYVIAYNGEIYNFRQLRAELDADAHPPWRGHSDTETLLAAIERWGIDDSLARFNGMFAFALWDRKERRLTLARDRLGIKPLYYGRCGSWLLFGSEIKALRAHPAFDRPIDRGAVALLLRHSYVPAPYSIYEGIHKLEPGQLLEIDAARPQAAAPRRFWSLTEVAERGQADPFSGGRGAAVDHLDGLLRDAVAQRMVADVPLGAFLSGGIDSSTVVALMQAQSSRPVRTFAIGFEEEGFDEAGHARAIAAHLGTEHTELYVTAADALAVIPRLPAMFDEPFSDSSQIPTFLVAELARRHVTVSLSGDGGDELFAGYPRYAAARHLWSRLRWAPAPLRNATAAAIRACPKAWLDHGFGWAAAWLSRYGRPGRAGDKLLTLADIIEGRDGDALYRTLMSHWKHPERVVSGSIEPPTALTRAASRPRLDALTDRCMAYDGVSYLPDDILVKVDRTSMNVSLEARVPLLDHRVVEFAWSLPLDYKLGSDGPKWPLRQVLYRYVPRPMVDRPKMGFGVPIGSWLRGPLREWAESLLDERRLREEGFFDPAAVRTVWDHHQRGERDGHYYLWDVLMFQAWLESSRGEQAGADRVRAVPHRA